jgi:hypothetical protein
MCSGAHDRLISWVTGHNYIAYGPLALGGTEIVFEASHLPRRRPLPGKMIQKLVDGLGQGWVDNARPDQPAPPLGSVEPINRHRLGVVSPAHRRRNHYPSSTLSGETETAAP